MRRGETLYLAIGSAGHYTSSGSDYSGKLFYLELKDEPSPRLYQKKVDSGSDPFFAITENLGSSNRDSSSPVFHDLNSDGVIDMMLGAYNGVHMMLNTGTKTQPIFLTAPLFPGTLTPKNAKSLAATPPTKARGDEELQLELRGKVIEALYVGVRRHRRHRRVRYSAFLRGEILVVVS